LKNGGVDMTEIKDQPEGLAVGDQIIVRIRLKGALDARWRRTYNELALSHEPPVSAEALAHQDETVIVVSLPSDIQPMDANAMLDLAEALTFDADQAAKQGQTASAKASKIASLWWSHRESDTRRFPGIRPPV
jgi:hypothetical protein